MVSDQTGINVSLIEIGVGLEENQKDNGANRLGCNGFECTASLTKSTVLDHNPLSVWVRNQE